MEGTNWRRQFSIGTDILDFYCPALRLCIELDGKPHYTIDDIKIISVLDDNNPDNFCHIT